jgi:hypothetical protein
MRLESNNWMGYEERTPYNLAYDPEEDMGMERPNISVFLDCFLPQEHSSTSGVAFFRHTVDEASIVRLRGNHN